MDDANKKTPNDQAVGYGRPPASTRFQKGQSGNPRGRPPKNDGRRAITQQIMSEKQRLSGQPRGARVLFTNLELIVMKLKQLAAAGHDQATSLYTRIVERFGHQEPPEREPGLLVIPERLTMEEWVAKYSPKDDPPGQVEQVE